MGEIIDRYGPANGRFTSPVPEGGPYRFAQRSMPYLEDANQYHRYKVIGDFADIKRHYDVADAAVQAKTTAYMRRFRLDWDNLVTHRGEVAPAFGSPGGGVQIELPMPAERLVELGLLRRIGVS
ncbi:MAG: TNT domain-containing protein [Rhodoglobus sp.]